SILAAVENGHGNVLEGARVLAALPPPIRGGDRRRGSVRRVAGDSRRENRRGHPDAGLESLRSQVRHRTAGPRRTVRLNRALRSRSDSSGPRAPRGTPATGALSQRARAGGEDCGIPSLVARPTIYARAVLGATTK